MKLVARVGRLTFVWVALLLVSTACITVEVNEAGSGEGTQDPGTTGVTTEQVDDELMREESTEDLTSTTSTTAASDGGTAETTKGSSVGPEQADGFQQDSSSETEVMDADDVDNERAPPSTTQRLPGTPSDFGPAEGVRLAVVGVAYDDQLNVRDLPNGNIVARLENSLEGDKRPEIYMRAATSDDILATLSLHGDEYGVMATGRTQQLTTTIWHEVRVGDLIGWSSGTFLAALGGTYDTTAEIVERLGETPVAENMRALALKVTGAVASLEPPSLVTFVEDPDTPNGDIGTATVDVVNIGDDSLLGYRLEIFAHTAAEAGSSGPYTLKAVESTLLCHAHRGVHESGFCN